MRDEPIRLVLPDRDNLGNEGLERRTRARATTANRSLSSGDLADQFLIFQFNKEDQGDTILDSTDVKPSLKGSDEKPDVLAKLQMVSFQAGDDDVDKGTKATLRIDMGKDKSSNSPLDTLFWSLSAGLNLYNEAKDAKAAPDELTTDLSAAFSNRPIEIPGGLAELSFEVVKHREPRWWQRVFKFLQSGTGTALTSAIGFPAITGKAVGFIDELVGRLHDDSPDYLFKSRPMTLALTEKAKTDFTGGMASIELGSMDKGFCLLARGRDYGSLIENDPIFFPHFKKLVPSGVSRQDMLAGNYHDPFQHMTYAVIRVGLNETKLSREVDFS
ncbi:hypothetical protein ABI59_12245 [Acidobacteria bacterium Mor1]|nr:hypothetical protein ABI59_12245 [Acidobacteria bacterium Mor1]